MPLKIVVYLLGIGGLALFIGLIAWQIAEGRRLWSHRKAPNRP